MKKLLLLITPVLLLCACKEEAVILEEPVKAVKTITIQEASNTNTRAISGTVKSSDESALSFRVGGRVATVNVNIGDKVKKGQILAKLDQKEYALDVKTAKAQLASARAELVEKTDALQRQKNLKEKDYVAQAAVDQAQAAFGAAKSGFDVAKTALDNAQDDFDNTTLKAPFDGAISSRSVDPFTEVNAGGTVFELQSEGSLKVEVLMPETLVRDITLDQEVKVQFPTLKNTTVTGNISEIGAKAETGNAFPVKIQIAETNNDIRSGMTAQVIFNFGGEDTSPVYLIPASALDLRIPPEGQESDRTKSPVFVVENGLVQKRVVRLRDLRSNEIEVTQGLKAGDVLIVAGVPYLREGQKVKPWEPTYNKPATIEQ